jgi:hypothetical protein
MTAGPIGELSYPGRVATDDLASIRAEGAPRWDRREDRRVGYEGATGLPSSQTLMSLPGRWMRSWRASGRASS